MDITDITIILLVFIGLLFIMNIINPNCECDRFEQFDATQSNEAVQNLTSVYNKDNIAVTNLNTTGNATINNLQALNAKVSNFETSRETNGNSSMTIGAGDYYYKLWGGGNQGLGGVTPNGFDLFQYDGKGGINNILRVDKEGSLINNGIKFSRKWTGSTDGATDKSEISNDTVGFKKLMIIGNRSAGGSRQVGLWDDVSVAGNLRVNGDLQIGRWTIRGDPDGRLLFYLDNNFNTIKTTLYTDGNVCKWNGCLNPG